MFGQGAALERIAVAAIDRVRGVDHQPVDLAVGEKGALRQRIVRRLLIGSERRVELHRFHRLLTGLQELVVALQPADLGQQLVRPGPVRVGGGADERRRDRRRRCDRLRRRSRLGGVRRVGRIVDGDGDVVPLRRRRRRGVLVVGLGLHGDGRGRRLQWRTLVLEAIRLDVGQHLVGPIAEVPGAVAAVQLLGTEGGALGLVVAALLHQLARLRQQLDRFFLVLVLAGGLHVLAQLFRRVLEQAPGDGGQRPQLGQRLDGVVDLVVGELAAALLEQREGLGLGLGRARSFFLAAEAGLVRASARETSASSLSGLSSNHCRSGFSARAWSMSSRTLRRSPASMALRAWASRTRAFSAFLSSLAGAAGAGVNA